MIWMVWCSIVLLAAVVGYGYGRVSTKHRGELAHVVFRRQAYFRLVRQLTPQPYDLYTCTEEDIGRIVNAWERTSHGNGPIATPDDTAA